MAANFSGTFANHVDTKNTVIWNMAYLFTKKDKADFKIVSLASTIVALASKIVTLATKIVTLASTIVALASKIVTLASTIVALASKIVTLDRK